MFAHPHPGVVLREYLGPASVTDAARRLDVSRSTLSAILAGRGRITATSATKFAHALGTSAGLWRNLQAGFDGRADLRDAPRLLSA